MWSSRPSPRSSAGTDTVRLRHHYTWAAEDDAVVVRGATAEDLSITLDVTAGGHADDRVDAIVLACVDGPGECPFGAEELESLILGDRNVVLASIARLTFGNTVDLTRRCSNRACGVDVEWQLILAELTAPSQPAAEPSRAVGIGDDTVTIRPATVADERAARRSSTPVDTLIARLAEPREALPVADADVRKRIEAELDELDPLASITFVFDCVQCQQPLHTTLDMPSLLYDLVRSDDARRPGDHHVLALGYRWGPGDLLVLRPAERTRFAETLVDMWDR
jgi:hypothetical protein